MNDTDDINIEIISDSNDFLTLKEDWNFILKESRINNPFLRHEWLSSWWQAYGGNKRLYILKFITKANTVGYAPFMQYNTRLLHIPVKTIGFLANHWTRMEFILRIHHNECMLKLVQLLEKIRIPVILAQLPKSSLNYNLLLQHLKDKRLLYSETHKLNATVTVPACWEEYLKNKSRNFRQTFTKKLRRLEKIGKLDLVKLNVDTSKVIGLLKEISSDSWQTKNNVAIVMTEQGEKFYRLIIEKWKYKKFLNIYALMVNNRPISYMVGIKYNNCYFAFDTAYRQDMARYSPGAVMHNLLIKKLTEENITELDLGYIAEYKKHWMDKSLPVSDIIIYPNTIIGVGLRMLSSLKEFIYKYKK